MDGRPAADYADLPASVAFFGEDAHVFATSVAENCRVARGDATEAEIAAALDAVGLGDWVRGLPARRRTPCSSRARIRSRAGSGGDCCWPGPW